MTLFVSSRGVTQSVSGNIAPLCHSRHYRVKPYGSAGYRTYRPSGVCQFGHSGAGDTNCQAGPNPLSGKGLRGAGVRSGPAGIGVARRALRAVVSAYGFRPVP